MIIDQLTLRDISDAVQLSTQSGWNQLQADWIRLLTLWPQFCFAGRENGKVVATSTIASYGSELGWIGMVLVDQAMRGRGCGTAILDAAIEGGDQAGIRVLGLDATELGEPLYLKRGFVSGMRVIRWARPAGLQTPEIEADMHCPLDQMFALDAKLTGLDRAGLLQRLSKEVAVRCASVRDGATLAAFGFRRAGRTADHIGPVVASTSESALRVLGSLLSINVGPAILVDTPESTPIGAWLEANHFVRSRTLVRMCRPAASPFNDAQHTYALSGFELG